MSLAVWQEPQVIIQSQIIVNSFRQLLGYDLISQTDNSEQLAHNLFFAPFIVVSHGIKDDPILNYGNQAALKLWETSWDDLIKTPSRLTAEPVNRKTRAKMLQTAAQQGYIDNYQGVRISSTGRRFLIKQAIVWNLQDRLGNHCGQAATFSDWTYLSGSF